MPLKLVYNNKNKDYKKVYIYEKPKKAIIRRKPRKIKPKSFKPRYKKNSWLLFMTKLPFESWIDKKCRITIKKMRKYVTFPETMRDFYRGWSTISP